MIAPGEIRKFDMLALSRERALILGRHFCRIGPDSSRKVKDIPLVPRDDLDSFEVEVQTDVTTKILNQLIVHLDYMLFGNQPPETANRYLSVLFNKGEGGVGTDFHIDPYMDTRVIVALADDVTVSVAEEWDPADYVRTCFSDTLPIRTKTLRLSAGQAYGINNNCVLDVRRPHQAVAQTGRVVLRYSVNFEGL